MQHPIKRATAAAATVVTIGFSSLFIGVGAANAAPVCSNGATLISSNVCELRITTVGATTVTPTADMSKLEVLLVGGGGNGADSTGGYSPGGGGGAVTVVGFGSDTSTPLDVVVGASTLPTTATQGLTTAVAGAGVSAPSAGQGGSSGNGNPSLALGGSGGGGAGGTGAQQFDGGPGATVDSVAPPGSLFAGVNDCYGGGGAGGDFLGSRFGTATCGGGYTIAGAAQVATPNTGGGGVPSADPALRAGGSGLAVLRWVALDQVTVTFAMNGHGAALASQTFYEGGSVTRPADPSAPGRVFNGWFTDAALTVPADFTAPITASSTFYASWSAAAPARILPATGGSVDPALAGIGLAALIAGGALIGLRTRIRRSTSRGRQASV